MLILKIGRKIVHQVDDLAHASRMYGKLRDDSNQGSSSWPDGKVVDHHDTTVAHISYNGRVWTKSCGELLLEAQS